MAGSRGSNATEFVLLFCALVPISGTLSPQHSTFLMGLVKIELLLPQVSIEVLGVEGETSTAPCKLRYCWEKKGKKMPAGQTDVFTMALV